VRKRQNRHRLSEQGYGYVLGCRQIGHGKVGAGDRGSGDLSPPLTACCPVLLSVSRSYDLPLARGTGKGMLCVRVCTYLEVRPRSPPNPSVEKTLRSRDICKGTGLGTRKGTARLRKGTDFGAEKKCTDV